MNNCEASNSGASGLQIFLLQFYVLYSEVLTVLLTSLVFIGWEMKYIFLVYIGILEFDDVENVVNILL